MENVDCYISENGYFIASDYNIKNLIDPSQSELSTMPEASESSAKIAGRDGEIVLSTNYGPISFNIVCYTEENLTPEQKILEENKIKAFLNNIKKNTVKLGIEDRNIYYNVKYSGSLTVVRYPKTLSFSIPLKSADSYGKILPNKKITGSGEEESNTIKEVGARITIVGPAYSPRISLNGYIMEYDANIASGAKLIIDGSRSTATHIDSLGRKTNQMINYNHQFPKIQNGTNTFLVLSGVDDEGQVTIEWNDLTL